MKTRPRMHLCWCIIGVIITFLHFHLSVWFQGVCKKFYKTRHREYYWSLCGQHRRGSHLFCNCYAASRGSSSHQQTCYPMPTSRSHTRYTRACTWWPVLCQEHLRTAKPFSRHYQHPHGFLEERNPKPVQNLCGKMAGILLWKENRSQFSPDKSSSSIPNVFIQSRLELLHDKHCKICLVIDLQY